MYCVELGIRQERDLWRMTMSIALVAETAEAARHEIQINQRMLLDGCAIRRVFAVEQAM